MSGPRKTPQRGPDPGTGLTDDKTNIGNIDVKLAAILSYVPVVPFNCVCSAVWLKTDQNKYLRFHAWQGLMLTGAMIAAGIVLNFCSFVMNFIPFVGAFVSMLGGLLWGVLIVGYMWLTINCIIDASKGTTTKLPYIGEIAEENA